MQLSTNNIYSDQYDQFKETSLAQRLEKKFEPKPYYQKFKWLRLIAFIASYVFNIFSGVTASILVYFFAFSLTGYIVPSAIITIVFLILLEASKRITVTTIFKDWLQFSKVNLGMLCGALALVGMSIVFSYHGSKKTVHLYTTPPTLLEASTADIDNRITNLTTQIAEARKTTWRGTTTTTSQQTINKLTDQIRALENEKIRTIQRVESQNDNTTLLHQSTTTLSAFHFAGITTVLELLFIVCAFFIEKYDYRSFAEFAAVTPTVIKSNDITVKTKPHTKEGRGLEVSKLQANDNPTITMQAESKLDNEERKRSKEVMPDVIEINNKEDIDKAIKHCKSRIAIYKYRLKKNIGTEETANKNLTDYTNQLNQLQTKLSEL